MNTEDVELTNIRIRPRPLQGVEVQIPEKAIADIDAMALRRGMSREALLRFYIGQGLRADLDKAFAERVLDKTASVLARHQLPGETVETILQEIRREAAKAM